MKKWLQPAFQHPAIKIIFPALAGNLLFITLQAQVSHSRRKENFDVHEFNTAVININAGGKLLQLHNMQGITVIDARADTSAIGFMQKKVLDPVLGALSNATKNQTEQRINKTPTFIMLGSGLQQEAKAWVDQSIVFPSNESLPGVLMVIKKLWLSDELNTGKQENSNGGTFTGPANRDVWTSGVDVRIEFYLREGLSYYPLYRYDSTISKAMTVSEYGSGFVALALQLSLQKMVQMDARTAAILGRKKFSLEEIQQHNQQDFNLPVLTENVLSPGVYMNFEEFKNNHPSQTKFELKKDRLTDIIYIKQQDGTDNIARAIWGYCDGKNAFIKSADNFFLLQRAANAFYVFGAKTIKRSETFNSTSTPSYSSGSTYIPSFPVYYTNSRTAVQLEPFQLDWSTGRLY